MLYYHRSVRDDNEDRRLVTLLRQKGALVAMEMKLGRRYIYIYTQYQRKDQSRICMSLIFLDGIDVYVQLHQCVIYYVIHISDIYTLPCKVLF